MNAAERRKMLKAANIIRIYADDIEESVRESNTTRLVECCNHLSRYVNKTERRAIAIRLKEAEP